MKTKCILSIMLCTAASISADNGHWDVNEVQGVKEVVARFVEKMKQKAKETKEKSKPVIEEIKAFLGVHPSLGEAVKGTNTPITLPATPGVVKEQPKHISTVSSYRTVISFEQIKQFARDNKVVIGGVVAVVLIGGTLYVMYQNGALEALVDWAIDHPRSTLLLTFTTGVVTALAVSKYVVLPRLNR